MLDARKPKSPRMFFVSDSGRNVMNQTVRLDKNVLFQKSMFVYIKVRATPLPLTRPSPVASSLLALCALSLCSRTCGTS